MLNLVHLSDIHFLREVSGGPFDLDTDLRNELERDLNTQLKEAAGGILVTGDIAYSGKKEEYDTALSWMRRLSTITQCGPSLVFTVPGNHDVDRDLVDSSNAVQDLHSQLRALDGTEIDRTLARIMGDRVTASGLLDPLGAYNEFALHFGCNITPEQICWEDNLFLNDGSTLRLHGLTSVIVSDRLDDRGTNKLVLGTKQMQLLREDGVEYLSLCHHPRDWILDSDALEDNLRRARIMLFGHKHRFRLHRSDDSLLLAAGATHPSRAEQQWQPRYNIIEVEVQKTSGKRHLHVKLNARVWDDNFQSFKPDVDPDGHSPYEYRLPLPDWSRPVLVSKESETTIPIKREPLVTDDGGSKPKYVGRPERELLYYFLSLPYQRQQQLALGLGLIAENERFSQQADLWRAVFTRARDKGQLKDLWTSVGSLVPDLSETVEDNPFDIGENKA